METKAITIYVENDIHVILNQIQQEIKQKSGKKIALTKIFTWICQKNNEKWAKRKKKRTKMDWKRTKRHQNERRGIDTQKNNHFTQEKKHSTQYFEVFTLNHRNI